MIIYFRRNTMDKLLEILEGFRCHLRRDNKTMFEFLSENYAQYITTLKESISPSDNTLVGEEMCRMVEAKLPEIESNAKQLLRCDGGGIRNRASGTETGACIHYQENE